jgi:hypothetical protein
MKTHIILILFFITFNILANGYNGTVSFTIKEKIIHYNRTNQFNAIGVQCLQDYKREHLSFYRNHCIKKNRKTRCLSKFYGERRFSKKRGAVRPEDGKPLTYLGDELARLGFPVSWMDKMKKTSCVGMALDCLERSFRGTGQDSAWKKIRKFVVLQNDSGGTELQHALQGLGWKVLYWNPAPYSTMEEDMERWDKQEEGWLSKGYHAWRYFTVTTKGTYYYNKIDDATTLVGFEKATPSYLTTIPFWIGTANTGYHVFPGTEENVVEAHSTRDIDSIDNLEFSFFSPLKYGGGPRWTDTEKYRSGMIAVPPGY